MIYIHVPFCRSFCTYCDFYSEIAPACRASDDARGLLFETFAKALCCEIRERADLITDDINTLYIGGGTPSVPPLSVLQSAVAALRDAGHGGPYDEFTVEVNPEDIVEKGHGYVEGLLELGVNRISMGVQSLDDDILRFMNRRHDAANARKAYRILEEAGVGNISIDLIFGLPQLSSERWRQTLDEALEISSSGRQPDHISSYQLSVEPGSALARMVEQGRFEEASEDVCALQYSVLCEILAQAGYGHYEISNFALPGREARHNSAYWAHVPYVGLGPGAHSFIEAPVPSRQWNEQDLKAYISASHDGSFGAVRGHEELTGEQLRMERLMLGLRTSRGIASSWLEENCDSSAFAAALASGRLVPAGDDRLRIPESLFFISDTIISELV